MKTLRGPQSDARVWGSTILAVVFVIVSQAAINTGHPLAGGFMLGTAIVQAVFLL